MTPFGESLRNFLLPPAARPLPAGLYSYQSPPDDPRNYRLHLRLEEDGHGILIINGSTILHLNGTAAEYAYYLVHNLSPLQAARKMAARYLVDADQAEADYVSLIDRIQTLLATPDLDPVTFFDFERVEPHGGRISAPYRLDCALTYQVSTADPSAAPVERVRAELSTAEWKRLLDKAWDLGIPHIIFTGGEPTLRPDLPELIGHVDRQVTGLLSDGLRLLDAPYFERILQAGLDHLMLILHPAYETSWQALETALAADLAVTVHLTLTEADPAAALAHLERLERLGAHSLSLSAADPAWSDGLQTLRDQAAAHHFDLVWNLPVPYSALNPVALELGAPPQTQTGRGSLYVEPDGDVLPAQGVNQPLGNFLTDPWEHIWGAASGD
jgi:hypothetical protein